MSDVGRPEAAAAIWNWQTAGGEPEGAALRSRQRGAVQSLVAAAIGAGLYLLLEWHTAAIVVWSITGLVLASALVSPTGLFAAIERGFSQLGAWVGAALTWIVMPPVFYLIFLPFGLMFRRGRSDALKRYTDAEATTYWKDRDPEWEATRSRERPF